MATMMMRFTLSLLLATMMVLASTSWCVAQEAVDGEAPTGDAALTGETDDGGDDAASEADAVVPPVTEDFDALIAAAAAAFAEKNYDAAMGYFERAYALDPDPALLPFMRSIMINMDPPRHRMYRDTVNR